MTPRRAFSLLGPALLVAPILFACGSGGTGPAPSSSSSSGGGGGPTSVSASGKAEANAAPSGSDVVAVWSVSSGSPDYLFVFGRGKVNGDTVTLDITSSPPAEALNKGGLGIAVLITVPPGTSVPDGKLSSEQSKALEGQASGISARHAIIYRADQAQVTRGGWETAFPQGYACGECVPHPEDAGPFDSFKTTDCSAIRLQSMASNPDICNWT